jgi:hypothetical protein
MERCRTLGFSPAEPGISPTYALVSQSTCAQRLAIADDVIVNDGEEAALDAGKGVARPVSRACL